MNQIDRDLIRLIGQIAGEVHQLYDLVDGPEMLAENVVVEIRGIADRYGVEPTWTPPYKTPCLRAA